MERWILLGMSWLIALGVFVSASLMAAAPLASGKTLPQHQGFDINIGGCHYGQPPTYFYPYFDKARVNGKYAVPIPGLEKGVDGEYLTDRLTEEALTYLDRHSVLPQPFLLYLAHYAVHTPLEAKAELIRKYEQKAATLGIVGNNQTVSNSQKQFQNHPAYAAMVESVDPSVGRILDRLETLKLVDNTVVVLMSDNVELYNLAEDVGETNDLSSSHPQVRDELLASLKQWQNTINPNIQYGISKGE